MKKVVAGALIGGASLMGLGLGAGHAEAKIEPGRYVLQTVWGAVPTPEYNATVVGNTMYTDYFGVGPRNLYAHGIVPTKNGGNASLFGTGPAAQWYERVEFHKRGNDYVGTMYSYGGVPSGTVYLKKTKRLANTR